MAAAVETLSDEKEKKYTGNRSISELIKSPR